MPYITLHRAQECSTPRLLSPFFFFFFVKHPEVISLHDFTVGAAETTLFFAIHRIMSLLRRFGEKAPHPPELNIIQ